MSDLPKKQNVGEDPTPAAQPARVLVKRLDDCWDRYRAELKRVRGEFANEYVHDLRVAIRRLVAAIEVGRAAIHQKKLKKSRRLLKTHLDAFDTLRDIQVQLAFAEELQEETPEIAPYCDTLREREKLLASRLARRVKEFSSTGISRQVARLRLALLQQDVATVEVAVWSSLDEAYAIVQQRQLTVRAEDPRTIHRTRLAFKKFRYLVEGIYPLMVNPPADYLRRLHDYQAAMGEVQDAEIGLQMLDDFASRKKADMPGVRAKFEQNYQARIATFVAGMGEVERFWRPAPDRKFPWEARNHSTKAK